MRPDDTQITLEAPLTIRAIHALKDQLQAAFENCSALKLSLPEDAEVDLAFLQLLESARILAEIQGKTLELARPAPKHIVAVLARAGFDADTNPATFNFWMNRKDNQ